MATEFTARAFREALARATAEIKAVVGARGDRAATNLASALRVLYPQGKTGRLRQGVVVRKASSGIGSFVRSNAPHVHFIEGGTKDRFDSTRGNARRGRVTARPIFIPTAIRERKSFLNDAQTFLDQPREL
jgi:hypothetical protein